MEGTAGWWALGAVVLFAGIALWMRARMEAQSAALRQEMQALLQAQAQSVGSQLAQLGQTMNQQLGQVTQALQNGVTDSGMLVAKAQEAVATELKSSREMMGRLQQQLGEVQQAGRDLHQATQTLQAVLGGAKSRGSLGEIGLERMLEDALPPDGFAFQFRFATGAVVDAILHAGEKIVPIDSKFPLDAYRRLAEGDEAARKDFAHDVRRHADAIAEKYILPEEGTLSFALMYVPSESVYYELLMTEEARAGRLDEYCRARGVIPVSPNTLHAYLGAILIGLRGLRVEENARRLLASLAGLQKQMETFAEVYEKLGTHLRNAQQSYNDADKKLERAQEALGQMAQGALPLPAEKAFEPATKE